MQWEMETFQITVISERRCGQDTPLADSSKCCLGYSSLVEGLFSGVSKIPGQQCHLALSGLCALHMSHSELSCGLNSPWWVFGFPVFPKDFTL